MLKVEVCFILTLLGKFCTYSLRNGLQLAMLLESRPKSHFFNGRLSYVETLPNYNLHIRYHTNSIETTEEKRGEGKQRESF
jgi:hypothetical protein